MSGPPSNIALRWLTALIILPVILVLIWVPALKIGFALLVAFVALTVQHEFLKLLRARQFPTSELASAAGGVIIIASAWRNEPSVLNQGLVAALIVVGASAVLSGAPSAAGVCGGFAALIYAVWCPAHALMMHQYPAQGAGNVMLLAVAVVLTDTAAYFTGKAIGSHPLAPVVSPKKTWEGAIGGFVFAVLGALVICWLRGTYGWEAFPEWPFWRYALTGAALSVVAQLSDLVKSSVKRDAGVKDSGHLLPGHGGALDRFDGFLFAAPVLYYMSMF